VNGEEARQGLPTTSYIPWGEDSRATRQSPAVFLRNVLARVVWIREEDDPAVRETALEQLEYDLAGWAHEPELAA
jgi:hypothetical protein